MILNEKGVSENNLGHNIWNKDIPAIYHPTVTKLTSNSTSLIKFNIGWANT
uniref:Uncharacterized protein n=1 Tax=Rhizophora mucronata TaxID=61149 RepID=A0A2P2LA70_RHIMU